MEENLTETLDTLYTELKGYKTGGNVTPSEMLEGSSGYSKGILVNGSIKKKEATTYIPGVNNITISKGQYLNGNQVIKGDTNLKPENIKSGVSIFGINGSIKDNSGKTLEATKITNDDPYTYLSVPEGIYDNESKVKVLTNELEKNLDLIVVNSTSVSYSVASGHGYSMSASYNCPSEYKPIFAVAIGEVWNVVATIRELTDTTVAINFSNTYDKTSTVSAHAQILCMKS